MKRLLIIALTLLAVSCGNKDSRSGAGKEKSESMKEVELSVLGQEDLFDAIAKQWMLITAGDKDSFNTMTASWGGFGNLWNRPVAFIFVRPDRYTHDFIERSDKVTLSFFPEQYRQALQICGTKSGRDCDKVAEAGLTPLELPDGTMTFGEARLVVDGKKIYKCELDRAGFIDPSVLSVYEGVKDLHTVYVLEIEKVYSAE